MESYLQSFSWNKVKYRADKPIAELADNLKKVYIYMSHTTQISYESSTDT